MSNRHIKILILLLGIFCASSISQAIPANDQANCTISTQAPSSPDDEDQSAVDNDDSGDPSDDLDILRGTSSWLPSLPTVGFSHGYTAMVGPQYSANATLESQHILLRL